MESYPLDTLDVGYGVDEAGYLHSAVKVAAVGREVLGYDVELSDPAGHKHAHLLDNLLDGSRLIAAGYERDGAEGAEAVTPLGYLEIGVMAGRGEHAVIRKRGRMEPGQVGDQRGPVGLAIPAVDLGDFGRQLGGIALRQASHYVEALYAAVGTQFGPLEYLVD